MIYPPFPADEHERIATLHALGILDTGREPSFDQVTDWASNYFQAPIALGPVNTIATIRRSVRSG